MNDGLAGIVEGFLVEHVMVGLGNIRARIDFLEADRIAADEPPSLDLRAIAGQIDRLESRARAVQFLLRDRTPDPQPRTSVADNGRKPGQPDETARPKEFAAPDTAAMAAVRHCADGMPAGFSTPDTERTDLTPLPDDRSRSDAQTCDPSAPPPDPYETSAYERETGRCSTAEDPDSLLAALVARLDRDPGDSSEGAPRDADGSIDVHISGPSATVATGHARTEASPAPADAVRPHQSSAEHASALAGPLLQAIAAQMPAGSAEAGPDSGAGAAAALSGGTILAPGVGTAVPSPETPVAASEGTAEAAAQPNDETPEAQAGQSTAALQPLLLVDPARRPPVPGGAADAAMPVFTSRRRRSAG